jgi:hypothetical protein
MATDSLQELLGCSTPADENACAREFIEGFASRAYRRPVTAEQLARLVTVFDRARQDFDLRGSIEQVVSVVLQSPWFLYRMEPSASVVRALDSFELASRLSYLLWGSLPDSALFDAAELGALSTHEEVLAQANRMVQDPRFAEVLHHFHAQWLDLPALEHVEKDAALFPEWGANIAGLLGTETRLFATETVRSGGTLSDLVTAPRTFLNQPLAEFYGLSGPDGNAFEPIELDPTRAAGILTQGSLMALHAKAHRSEPIFRGIFVRSALLCSPPPAPPPGVAAEVNVDENLTGRERLEAHRADPACQSCHELFDPIGFGFENYDAIGRYRQSEAGLPIDASGEVIGTDVDGRFSGPVELGQKLVASQRLPACVVGKWFTFGYGRLETAQDACSRQFLEYQLEASGGALLSLVLALTQTEAFLYKGSVPAEGG